MLSNTMKIVALLLCAMMAACASNTTQTMQNGTSQATTITGKLPAPDSTANTAANESVSEYHVGPQDLLEISIFQVKDLDRTVRVNSGGQISLPLIGVVQAGGKTVQELEVEIASKLAKGYLQAPQVSVFVKEFTSQRVTVDGAVGKPGIFPLTGDISLLQTIATAGGITSSANLKGVVVFRMVGGKKMAAVFDLKKIRAGKAEDPQIYGGDIVVVDESGTKTAISRIISAVPLLNVFSIY